MNETFEQMALRVAKEIGMQFVGPEDEIGCIRFATCIRDELCKGQEPVAWVEERMLYDDGFTHAFSVEPYANEGYVPLYLHPAHIPADLAPNLSPSYAKILLEDTDLIWWQPVPQEAIDQLKAIAAYEKEQGKWESS